jgi:uncharacterized protein YktA (UPF0223 family)
VGKKAFTEFQKEVAFDAYYAMGAARDLKALSISLQDTKKVQAQTDKSVVNSKADHRKLIKELLEQDNTLDGYAITLVGTAFDLITSGEMKVQTIKELVELMRTHQGSTAKKLDLIKTDLLLMGEADSRSEEKIIIVNDLTGAGDED